MRIAIIGTGGVGGYFGGKLARLGLDVTFAARGKHLNEIKLHGLKVKSINGDFHLKQCIATDRLDNIGPVDFVILAVKAWQVEDVVEDVKSILKKDGLILPLQNGVMTSDQLLKVLNSKNVLGGTCKILSKIESPGVINHFGVEPSIVFGHLGANPDESKVEKLKSLFDQAGIYSKISEDIRTDIWKKFAFICVGGLLAVHHVSLGTLRENPESRKKISKLITEIYLLAKRIGIHLGDHFINHTISFIDSLPHETSFSLARDIWEGRPSELEFQNGVVVKLGESYGISTPINSAIYQQLEPLEKMARAKH